jgi:hypothetical protein
MSLAFEARDTPDLDAVRRWFKFQITLLDEERARVLSMLQASVKDVPASWKYLRCLSYWPP